MTRRQVFNGLKTACLLHQVCLKHWQQYIEIIGTFVSHRYLLNAHDTYSAKFTLSPQTNWNKMLWVLLDLRNDTFLHKSMHNHHRNIGKILLKLCLKPHQCILLVPRNQIIICHIGYEEFHSSVMTGKVKSNFWAPQRKCNHALILTKMVWQNHCESKFLSYRLFCCQGKRTK